MGRFYALKQSIVASAVLAAHAIIPPASFAEEPSARAPHRVPRVGGAFKVDAKLDEAFWANALVLELRYEVSPGENVAPPVRTEVLLAYNDSHFLAAFRAYDPEPARIRAHLSDHDRVVGDDWVALILDTFNEKRRSFDFFVNALGVQGDAVECETCANGEAWDAIWDAAGRIGEDGYVTEIAIPFSSLRFQRSEGDQVWRIDAVRSYPRSVDHRIGLFPRDRSNNCYLCQAEEIVGFAGASPGRNIELDPTLTSIYTQARDDFPDGPFEGEDPETEIGLSARWGVTPNLMLNGAVNPDFSQVEADAAQLDINTTFALFYPEKRPFFLESAEFFETPIQAVYTRSLADPDWGAKLTGKEGRHTIGFFTVRDGRTNLLLPGLEGSRSTSLDMESYGTVARYKHDLFSSSSIGVLATSRFGDDYANHVGGADGLLKFTKTDLLEFQVLGSMTEYPDAVAGEFGQPADRLRDFAVQSVYSHDAEKWGAYGYYFEAGEDFRADLGFLSRVGYRFWEVGFNRNWYGDSERWFSKIIVATSFDAMEERGGDPLHHGLNWLLSYSGPLQSTVNLQGEILSKKWYRGVEYEYDCVLLNLEALPRSWLQIVFDSFLAENIDYANGRQGTSMKLSPAVVLKGGRHLSLRLDHVYSILDVDEGRLYTANVSQARFVLQATKRFMFRAIAQYVNYDRDPALYLSVVPANERSMLTQLLFSYKINPQTVLYVGYSDNYFGGEDIDLTQADRTFFAKLGYAWVI